MEAKFRRLIGSPWLQGFYRAAWGMSVLLLPLTSLPLLIRLTGLATVAPPSVILLGLLAAAWLLPYVLQGGKLPLEVSPFLVFSLVAMIAWLASIFLAIPPFLNKTSLSEAPEAFATLLIGMAVYLVSAGWLQERRQIHTTLRLVNWSGLALLAWSICQAYFVLFHAGDYPKWVHVVQGLISSRRESLFGDRLTGMAYEPSWLAHQLNMLYLPLWISATLNRFTAHQRRIGPLTLENLLLSGGVFVMLLSKSRVGILALMLVAAFLAIQGNLWLVRRLNDKMAHRLGSSRPRLARLSKAVMFLLLLGVFLVVYLAATTGLVALGARFDRRIARAIQQNPLASQSFWEATNKLSFAERVVYWDAGLKVFAKYPLLGVGLGNAGFYFPQTMPDYAWALLEVSSLFNYNNIMPNIKSLWVRILAETGLVGFSTFLAWIFLLWQSFRLSRRSGDPLVKMVGLAGQLVLVGFLLEGFSIDSFALPYIWFTLGLSTAVSCFSRCNSLL